MGFVVRQPGLASLLVGPPRVGGRAFGLPLGGPADIAAFQLANALLGNDPLTPALELTLAGPTLIAESRTAAVVFGAPFDLFRNNTPIEAGTTFELGEGDELRIGGTPTGCRGYLAVGGGFALPKVPEVLKAGERLECASSKLKVGRSLGFVTTDRGSSPPPAPVASLPGSTSPRPGEVEGDFRPSPLEGEGKLAASERGRGVSAAPPLSPSSAGAVADPLPQGERVSIPLRVLPGPQADWFPPHDFSARTYTVSATSNRMGVRFTGEPITRRPGELVSEAVAPGAIQITNDGLPIALGVDGQTIGGYPKMAHVIRADLDALGQLRPGTTVRFVHVTEVEAIEAARQRALSLRTWLTRLAVTSGRPV